MGTEPQPSRSSASVQAPLRRRRWRKWLLLLGIPILLIGLFQKAILLAAIRWEIAHYAAGEGLQLSCEIGGDPIHFLEIRNLDLVTPEPGALASLKIKRLKATYHILGLIFSGWDHVFDDVEVEEGNLILRESTQGSASGSDSFWVPFPRSLRLKNFTLERGALHLRGVNLELLPDTAGAMTIGELSVPDFGTWRNLRASTVYERSKIELKGLELKPYVKADSFKLDGSDLAVKKVAIMFQGFLFGGATDLSADWQEKKEGDFLKLNARGKNLSLARVSELLKPEKKFGGLVETLDLQFTGLIQDRSGWDGSIQTAMENGTVEDLPAWTTLALKAEIDKGQVTLDQFALLLDQQNHLLGKGKVQLVNPFRYAGDLQGGLEDLSSLQGLLELAGIRDAVAGKLEVNWSGDGEGGLQAGAKHQGRGFLTLQGGKWGGTEGIETEIRGDYTPDRAAFQTVRASASGWKVAGTGGWQNRRLNLQSLQVFHGDKQLLTGSVDVPFYPGDWQHPGQWLTPEDPVNIQLQGRNIQLEALMNEFGSANPRKGEVTLDLNASGTMKDLQLKGAMGIKNLVSGLNPDFLPAQLQADLQIEKGQLNVTATLTQPSLQPVKFWGNTKFDAEDFLNGNDDWRKNPITAEWAMASLDLSRGKRFFPRILELQGRAGADVHLGGSVDEPLLWGAIDIEVPRLRFNQRAIPNLTAFVARLKFDKRRMSIETMRGDLAGGPFQITGTIDFSKLSDPLVDMHLNGTDLLLYRDDHVTSRANVILAMNGPFNKAKVAGTVALTKSQFFRNIDILPIALPGQSAPQVQSSVLPEFSVKIPPLRDWTFDINISNKDPFLIKGNLANGVIDTHLHLTGTGLAPQLDGVVSVTNLEATLPFSTMLIDRGFLYFKPGQGLNATIDFRGTSKIQDYQVTVYVYGTLLRPQTLFVSQPPLSEQDIIALIATGATTTELGSNSNVIAGKATSLLFQKIWRKLFPNQKVSKNELLDRVDFNVGGIDPSTGSPLLGASLKVTDDIYLVFDSGSEGNFRGRLKYLIRFR